MGRKQTGLNFSSLGRFEPSQPAVPGAEKVSNTEIAGGKSQEVLLGGKGCRGKQGVMGSTYGTGRAVGFKRAQKNLQSDAWPKFFPRCYLITLYKCDCTDIYRKHI